VVGIEKLFHIFENIYLKKWKRYTVHVMEDILPGKLIVDKQTYYDMLQVMSFFHTVFDWLSEELLAFVITN